MRSSCALSWLLSFPLVLYTTMGVTTTAADPDTNFVFHQVPDPVHLSAATKDKDMPVDTFHSVNPFSPDFGTTLMLPSRMYHVSIDKDESDQSDKVPQNSVYSYLEAGAATRTDSAKSFMQPPLPADSSAFPILPTTETEEDPRFWLPTQPVGPSQTARTTSMDAVPSLSKLRSHPSPETSAAMPRARSPSVSRHDRPQESNTPSTATTVQRGKFSASGSQSSDDSSTMPDTSTPSLLIIKLKTTTSTTTTTTSAPAASSARTRTTGHTTGTKEVPSHAVRPSDGVPSLSEELSHPSHENSSPTPRESSPSISKTKRSQPSTTTSTTTTVHRGKISVSASQNNDDSSTIPDASTPSLLIIKLKTTTTSTTTTTTTTTTPTALSAEARTAGHPTDIKEVPSNTVTPTHLDAVPSLSEQASRLSHENTSTMPSGSSPSKSKMKRSQPSTTTSITTTMKRGKFSASASQNTDDPSTMSDTRTPSLLLIKLKQTTSSTTTTTTTATTALSPPAPPTQTPTTGTPINTRDAPPSRPKDSSETSITTPSPGGSGRNVCGVLQFFLRQFLRTVSRCQQLEASGDDQQQHTLEKNDAPLEKTEEKQHAADANLEHLLESLTDHFFFWADSLLEWVSMLGQLVHSSGQSSNDMFLKVPIDVAS